MKLLNLEILQTFEMWFLMLDNQKHDLKQNSNSMIKENFTTSTSSNGSPKKKSFTLKTSPLKLGKPLFFRVQNSNQKDAKIQVV
jgi:hypothetical protein